MRRSLLAILAVLCLGCVSMAQTQKEAEYALHVRKIFVLNQLVAVLIRPSQAKALLPVIEAANAAEARLRARELETLKANEGEIKAAIKVAAIGDHSVAEQGTATTVEMLNKLAANRQDFLRKEVEKVRQAMLSILDKGQINALNNGFDPRIVDPNLDDSRLTLQQKQIIFVSMILLDPTAWSYLTHKSESK